MCNIIMLASTRAARWRSSWLFQLDICSLQLEVPLPYPKILQNRGNPKRNFLQNPDCGCLGSTARFHCCLQHCSHRFWSIILAVVVVVVVGVVSGRAGINSIAMVMIILVREAPGDLGLFLMFFNVFHPCPNHDNVRLPRAYGYQCIHVQTITTFVFREHTVASASMPKPNHKKFRASRAYGYQCTHAPARMTFVFREHTVTSASIPKPNHNKLRASRAYGYRCIHAQTMTTFVFREHTVTSTSMPKP